MQWTLVSAACAVIGLVCHALSEWQNIKTRAAIAELKVDLIDRLNKEGERARDAITPLAMEAAKAHGRLDALESEVTYLRSSRPGR